MVGSIDRLLDSLGEQYKRHQVHGRTATALDLSRAKRQTHSVALAIGRSGDPAEVLAMERLFITDALVNYANSATMKTSLENSLADLAGAARALETLGDPARYRETIDAHHLGSRSRAGGLPLDEARTFFRAQGGRLLNLDKSQLDGDEKALIEIRRGALRQAQKSYIARQRAALGLHPTPPRAPGRAMER